MDRSVINILKDRKADKETVARVENQRIDVSAVLAMSEDELERYIPCKGDRVAVIALAKKRSDKEVLKTRLLEKFGSKHKKGKKPGMSDAKANVVNTDCAIAFHWSNYEDGLFKSVGKVSFGGERHVRVDKMMTKCDLIEEAKKLYFENGKSTKGEVEEFLFDMSLDARGKKLLNEGDPVEDVIDRTKIKHPRFYLLSKLKSMEEDEDEDDKVTSARTGQSSKDLNLEAQLADDDEILFPSSKKTKFDGSEMAESWLIHPGVMQVLDAGATQVITIDASTSPMVGAQAGAVTANEKMIGGCASPSVIGQTGLNTTGKDKIDASTPLMVSGEAGPVITGCVSPLSTGQAGSLVADKDNTDASAPLLVHGQAAAVTTGASQETLTNMTAPNLPATFSGYIHYDLLDIDYSIPSIPRKTETVLNITLRRGSVLEDFIQWMVQHDEDDLDHIRIEVTLLRTNGQREEGQDNGGLLRDALTEFWEDFYLKYTSGNLNKVPEIMHTMGENRWRAVAKIIVLGYKQVGYYPTQVALPFMAICLYETYNESTLTEAFLNFMAESDRLVIKRALEKFSDVSEDELLDALEEYDLKRVLTQTNFKNIVSEIAHKKLIQESAYVADIWKIVLMVHLRPLIGDSDNLEALHNNLHPTSRRIIELLRVPSEPALTTQEECLVQWLKKLIKSFSDEKCKKFLRFCTGADLVIVPKIDIRFYPAQSQFSRRIIAHTCGCVLELPAGEFSYTTFNELRSEVSKILDSGYLEMDFV